MLRPLAVLALVLALAVAACSDDEDGPQVSESPTAQPAVTPAPAETSVPTPPQAMVYQAIFLRTLDSVYPEAGELWASGLDGLNAHRLTAEGESASFAGVAPHPVTRGRAVFYVTLDSDTARTIWAVDMAMGGRSKVLSFDSRRSDLADAAVSPDGKFVAYAGADGIELFDIETGEQKHLLDNGPMDCDAGNCLLNSSPQWSPNSALLMVRRTFWEGGTNVTIDPFLNTPIQIPYEPKAEPFTSRWAPGSDAACGYGRYAENSGLHFAEPPGWSFVNVLPEYEKYPPDLPLVRRQVSGCAFLDGQEVAFTVDVIRYDSDPAPGPPPQESVELRVFESTTGTSGLVAEFKSGGQISNVGLFAFPGTQMVLTQQTVDEGGNGRWEHSQPQLVDITNGQESPVLEHGDRVLAVIAR